MIIKKAPILLSLALIGCSTPQYEKPQVAARHLASFDKLVQQAMPENASEQVEKIYHSYLLGQSYLQEFDRLLDERPEEAMSSQTYYDLLAIRTIVDEAEDEVNELHPVLSMVAKSSLHSHQQRQMATESLHVLDSFMAGETVPEELRPLILSNLLSKQSHQYGHLLAPQKMKFDLTDYSVDVRVLDQAITQESSKESFQKFQADVKKLGKQIGSYINEVRGGRSTSSDVIFPSTGSSGNITGRTFPNNTWSLTFDDGPGSKTSPQILSMLKEKKVKASFFMLAKQVEALPSTAKSIADAGMDIASHSYTHAQLTKVGAQTLEKEIGTAKKVIENKLGKKVKLFRLPYGAGVSVNNIRSKIAAHGMVHVFWNVDTLDWQDKNPQSILARSIKQMKASPKNSGVILFHDIHQQTVVASRLLLEHMQKNKIKVCTVQSVVDQLNKGLDTCE